MFDLSSFLTKRKELVDRELGSRLPPEGNRPEALHRAMRYAVSSGGKRIRPILCLAACEAVGGAPDQALGPALAVELFHAYTLVHDDLPAMDDDALRRGNPTTHIAFGEANAILAGDALLTLAFEWLALDPPPAPYTANDYVLELARAGGHAGVIAGQVEDLAAEEKSPTPEDVEYIHEKKTGALICAAARIGAMAGGADAGQLEMLTAYSREIGLAFQIADDVLNATSTADLLGKATGSDQERGKTTYVAVYGIERARVRADELVESALGHLSRMNGSQDALAALARYVVARRF